MLVSCLAYSSTPEDGSDMFLWNANRLSTDYSFICQVMKSWR
jgi:hypothetical protein